MFLSVAPLLRVIQRLEFSMFNHYNLEEINDRARAAFIGMAIGDALGATVEFMNPSEIAKKYGIFKDIVGGGWLHLKPGQVTDDTEMALCIAGYCEEPLVTGAVAGNFAAWLTSRPVDCGDTCRKGIRLPAARTLESPLNEWTPETAPPCASFRRRRYRMKNCSKIHSNRRT
jgi:ADP-ribosyl-[dinitrogen reductase] hydrolase